MSWYSHDFCHFGAFSNSNVCWVFMYPNDLLEEIIVIAAELQLAQDGDRVEVYDGKKMF